ncbi:hypothetical protein [Actinoplanes sp. L3-i22]|uniref:lipase/acyltransferase domain-containing protein n=1 Tax=Actinoplanes sp. L3-i22 TaxID=2836373 RepID=UPI001C74BDA1|nr:hypothetical protein [Actinoplanes sp. L3-i22]BCY08790.1 hypothetical protein L3i22_038780 [Actinoplanes sp. L3-i22]
MSVESIALQPLVGWPRQVAPGGRHLVTVDLRPGDPHADWPYEDEEYPVGLMLSGQIGLTVESLGQSSVVLHRFGGTYGPARFVVTVDDGLADGTETALWLTLISAGGVPFHTARLAVTVTGDPPVRPVADVPPGSVPQSSFDLELRPPVSIESEIGSMVAVTVDGRATLALGCEDGVVRLWTPGAPMRKRRIGSGPAKVAGFPTGSRTLVAVAAGDSVTILDPATDKIFGQGFFGGPETAVPTAATSLLVVPVQDRLMIALGTADGRVQLFDHRGSSLVHVRDIEVLDGPVLAMCLVEGDGRPVLVVGGTDPALNVVDVVPGLSVRRLAVGTARVNQLTTFGGSGGPPSIVAACDDGLRTWELPGYQLSYEYSYRRAARVTAVTDVPRSGVVWGDSDGTLGNLIEAGRYAFRGSAGAVTALAAFERDGRQMLAIAQRGRTLSFLDLTEVAPPRAAPRDSGPRRDSGSARDAVVFIPGFMGSELVDIATGESLWGTSDMRWYIRAAASGAVLDRLRPTAEELAGRNERVRAKGLLRAPGWAPLFGGIEPYTALLKAIDRAVPHPDAVLTFPYDWRLSVKHNAGLLAEAAQQHLEQWRRHHFGSREARLVLVGSSMGGLIARYFTGLLGGADYTRLTIGIGVPYRGTVAAFENLAGRRPTIPLPRARFAALFRAMPGTYDLLPFYRCVIEEGGLRRITPRHVAEIGGDAGLAAEAMETNERLWTVATGRTFSIVGIDQPTYQGLQVEDGQLRAVRLLPGLDSDFGGDGTVPRFSALPPGGEAQALYLSQSASGLLRDQAVLDSVRGILAGTGTGSSL